MKTMVTFTSALLLVSGTALADVTLNLGEHVEVTNIDGQEIKTGFLTDSPKKFTLKAGSHVIQARYNRLYDVSKDEHEFVKSSSLAIPVTLQDNQTYVLDMINQPEVFYKAQQYAEKPTLALLQNGNVLTKTDVVASSNSQGLLSRLFGGQQQAYRVQPQVTVQQAMQPQVAENAAVGNAQPAVVQSPKQVVQKDVGSTSTLDNFMRVWLNASPAERQKIKAWVKDQ